MRLCMAPYRGALRERLALALQNDVLEGNGKTKRGEPNGYRNDTSGHPGAGAGGRDSNLASQQGMGLWSQRRGRFDTGDRVDFIRAGQDIAVIFHRAACSAYNRSNRT